MKRIIFVDTYYQPFLASLPRVKSYPESLNDTLNLSFGTFDAFSRALRLIGWTSTDIIANYGELQDRWAREHQFLYGQNLETIAMEQIRRAEPDVVFMQDLSFFSQKNLMHLASRYLLAGQCSCAMPVADKVRCFHLIFTSFPHYVDRFKALGVRSVFLPLAFDPIVIDRVGYLPIDRDIDCVFVGGIGDTWSQSALRAIAIVIPGAQFYGYGYEMLDKHDPIRRKYVGSAWGLDMYRVLSRAKVVINRHSKHAIGFANNLRMFEATGCGALLVTEAAQNLRDYFDVDQCCTYQSGEDAVIMVERALAEEQFKRVAANGHRRTLRTHRYTDRARAMADALEGR